MLAAAVLVGLAAALLLVLAGRGRDRMVAGVSAAAAAAAFGITLAAWRLRAPAVEGSWSASWGLRFRWELDGLGALYALLASGIGLLVVIYAAPYMRHHLHEQKRPLRDLVPFFAQLLLFLSAMVALAMAQELFTLFIAWETTAIASAFLIGTDRHDPDARHAAFTALVVTAGASVPFIAGIVLLQASYGTTSIEALLDQAAPGPTTSIAAALIALAALAKSAQVPLHFWLPRAMVAPTPVSAYLHSAAMVAAGVFLLSRLHPLLAASPVVMAGLAVAGAASVVVGSLMALTRDRVKEVLAYSTIAQYGYVTLALGTGTQEGAVSAALYVLPHGLAKSGLFLVAGAVVRAAGGEDRLSRLGGFGRTHPGLAAAAALCAASLAGLPLTGGFFKDDHFFAAVLAWRAEAAPLAVLATALTLAYTWRFWRSLFRGRPAAAREPVPALMSAPVFVLAALSLAGGLAPSIAGPLVGDAARAIDPRAGTVELAYHLDARPENLMALGTWALAMVLIWLRADAAPSLRRLLSVGGPAQAFAASLAGLRRVAGWLREVESRDLRDRVGAVLVPGGLLVGLAVSVLPLRSVLRVGQVVPGDLTLLFLLLLVGVAAVGAVRSAGQLGLVLAVSMVNYAAALAFAAFGAPDVALVAVLVQTVTTVLLVAVLRLFPPDSLRAAAVAERRRSRREWAVSSLAGGAAFVLTWVVLSSEPAAASVAGRYLELAPESHARDVVTAILADFRGLDTMGEATVVVIALLAIAALLAGRGGRR